MRFRMLFTRSVVGVAATAAVAAGTVAVTAAPAAAAPAGVVEQNCAVPLLGGLTTTIRVSTDLPVSVPVGQSSPESTGAVVFTLPETAGQGLALVGAARLEGTLTVPFEGRYSDGRTTGFSRTLPIQDVVVAGAAPIVISGEFRFPATTEQQPVRLDWHVGAVRMTLSPKTTSGQETGLGTFDSACAVVAGADTRVGTVEHRSDPGGIGHSCPFPLVGNQRVLQVNTPRLATSVPVGATVGGEVDFAVTFSTATAHGLELVGASSLAGSIRFTTARSFNGSPLSDDTATATFDQVLPTSSREFTIRGAYRVTEFTADAPGVYDFDVKALNLDLRPLTDQGDETGLGAFTSACAVEPGQDLGLASVRVGPGPEPAGVAHTCPFPLVGDQKVVQANTPRLPASVPVGANAAGDVDFVLTLPGNVVRGLQLVGGKTLTGTARFTSQRSLNGGPATEVQSPVAFEPVAVPDTAGATVEIRGTYRLPDYSAPATGVLAYDVGALALTLRPLRSDGADTGLGEFESACAVNPGQDLRLATVGITQPTPPGLAQSCPFPLIGTQAFTLDPQVRLPSPLRVGQSTPAAVATTRVTLSQDTTTVLNLVGADRLAGELRVPVQRTFGGDTTTQTETATFDVAVPAGGVQPIAFDVALPIAAATAPAPGTMTWGLGDLSYTMTPTRSGEETGLGTFDAACAVRPGQQNTFASVVFEQAEPTRFAFDLSGSATFAAAKAKGDLAGTLVGTLADGKVEARLEFGATSLSLRYAGLPVTARVRIAPTGPATGTVTGGVVAGSVNAHVEVQSVTLFGMGVRQAATCRTTQPSRVDIASAPGFTAAGGGTLNGTFAVARFAGCDAYTAWVNSTLSGPGNTFQVKATPRP
ncbi:DUF6801 domain-containing protein [Actinokineospora sp. G85]|uniref:DUF6801 domain-containing protein n=1 Tax=Actinokineospora sp. G85 TaxID=3406626 RepID=UPI003C792277